MCDGNALDELPPDWARRLAEVVIDEEIAALESDWVVACTDPVTGMATYSGPYASGADAMVVVNWEKDNQAKLRAQDRFEFTMIRLSPPTPVADGAVVTVRPPA